MLIKTTREHVIYIYFQNQPDYWYIRLAVKRCINTIYMKLLLYMKKTIYYYEFKYLKFCTQNKTKFNPISKRIELNFFNLYTIINHYLLKS